MYYTGSQVYIFFYFTHFYATTFNFQSMKTYGTKLILSERTYEKKYEVFNFYLIHATE